MALLYYLHAVQLSLQALLSLGFSNLSTSWRFLSTFLLFILNYINVENLLTTFEPRKTASYPRRKHLLRRRYTQKLMCVVIFMKMVCAVRAVTKWYTCWTNKWLCSPSIFVLWMSNTSPPRRSDMVPSLHLTTRALLSFTSLPSSSFTDRHRIVFSTCKANFKFQIFADLNIVLLMRRNTSFHLRLHRLWIKVVKLSLC